MKKGPVPFFILFYIGENARINSKILRGKYNVVSVSGK